jgi:glycosyltransferase involved in cell wall biosynthesis
VKAEKPVRGRRIALVHDYWVTVLGGERMFQRLARLFPDADTYVFIRDPQVETPPKLAQLRSTYLHRLALGARHFRALPPLYPAAARTDGAHLRYCRSLLRYAWNVCEATLALQLAGIRRALVAATLDRLRRADLVAARRVTRFVAHSGTVRQRVATYCGRPATIVRPCIDIQRFRSAATHGDTFLVVSHLLPYKRVDPAIAACARLELKFEIIGVGPERPHLEQLAGPTVTFRGRVSEADIGMAALEARAAGRPVIAYRAGGALETIISGRSGILCNEQSVERLEDALCALTPDELESDAIPAHAEVCSEPEFRLRILAVVREIGSAPHQVSGLLRRDPSAKARASEPAQQDGQSGSAWRRWRRHQDDVGGGGADDTEWRRGADQEVAKW